MLLLLLLLSLLSLFHFRSGKFLGTTIDSTIHFCNHADIYFSSHSQKQWGWFIPSRFIPRHMTALWICTVFLSGRNFTKGISHYWRIRLNEMWCDKWAYWGEICYYLHRFNKKAKVKWSRYRLGVAQRVGRGIALLFHDRGTRRGWVVSSTLRPHLTPGKDPVPILQEVGWAPRGGLDGRKISSPPGFDPGPSSQ